MSLLVREQQPAAGNAPGETPTPSAHNQKQVLRGTHRVCPPEATLAWISPLLPAMGITRLADITCLDEIGIPVFQAICPNSRQYSVQQGKGLTPALARVSAAMEAIERWHGQVIVGETIRASVRKMADVLPYDPYQLTLQQRNVLNDEMELEWVVGRLLGSGRPTFVPMDLIYLNCTVRDHWTPPLFMTTSNGLAAGNTMAEATAHGLYEAIEHDCLARVRDLGNGQGRQIDVRTVEGADSASLLERLRDAGATVEIFDITGPTHTACFEAVISSPAYPGPFGGLGCHLDKEVALCRALTEAAQSRLTYISGARDDLEREVYSRVADGCVSTCSTDGDAYSYEDVPSLTLADLDADLDELTQRVSRLTGCDPIVVDRSRTEIGIPVVHVVAPGLREEKE